MSINDVLGKNPSRHYHFHLACFSTETETRLGLAIESTKAKPPLITTRSAPLLSAMALVIPTLTAFRGTPKASRQHPCSL